MWEGSEYTISDRGGAASSAVRVGIPLYFRKHVASFQRAPLVVTLQRLSCTGLKFRRIEQNVGYNI